VRLRDAEEGGSWRYCNCRSQVRPQATRLLRAGSIGQSGRAGTIGVLYVRWRARWSQRRKLAKRTSEMAQQQGTANRAAEQINSDTPRLFNMFTSEQTSGLYRRTLGPDRGVFVGKNNRVSQTLIQDRVSGRARAMRSRYSFWWTWLSASVTLFVGQRLSAVGELIARELERSYATSSAVATPSEGRRWKSPASLLRFGRKKK